MHCRAKTPLLYHTPVFLRISSDLGVLSHTSNKQRFNSEEAQQTQTAVLEWMAPSEEGLTEK